MADGSRDTSTSHDRARPWAIAVTAICLVVIGLVWLLSNIGPRGPRLVALWQERGRGFGIHVLDPLGLIPLVAGEVILIRARITSVARVVAGTLLMAVGIGWMTRASLPQGPLIVTVFADRGLHGSDLVGIGCIAGAIALLLMPLHRTRSNV